MKILWPSEGIWLAVYFSLSAVTGALSIAHGLPDPWLIMLAGPVVLSTARYPRRTYLIMLGIVGILAAGPAVAFRIKSPVPPASIVVFLLSTGIVAELMLRFAEVKRRSEDHVRSHDAYLAALHETSLGLINHRDLNQALSDIVTRAAALLGTPHGYLYLAKPDGEYLEVKLGIGVFSGIIGSRLKSGEGLSGQVWQTGQAMMVPDYSSWAGRAKTYDKAGFRAIAAVPLKSGQRIVGVIGVSRAEAGSVFSETEMDVLGRFADLASIAVENAALHEELQVDLDERKRLQDALLRQATTDFLTGISNRAHFMHLFRAEIQRSARYRRPLSVLVLDIDRFKAVNDSRGHAAGDEALRTLVKAIDLSGLRQSDFVGRLGGDEFAIALPETTVGQASVVVERIRKSLNKIPVLFQDEEFFITASIGAAEYLDGDDQDTLLQRADEAMYIMKQSWLPGFRF